MTSTTWRPSGQSVGSLLGSQAPRLFHVPEYVTSAGTEAVELAALAGLVLDPWEASVLMGALGEREDGKWAAFEVGLVVPRQNGKGSILEARELAGLFLFGEKLIIHSAHEQATSSEHFQRLLNLIEGVPEFERRILSAPKGKGAEAIKLRGGQRIFFKTRTGGGARGLTGDLVVLDEAMILPRKVTSSLVPTMAARSIHGNPQLWYTGSAVDQQEQEHGVVLASVRERGLKPERRVAYFEFSAPGDNPSDVPDDALNDPHVWAQANPGLGIRISEEHIAGEIGALGARAFAVERLGIGDWPATDETGDQVIPLAAWNKLIDPASTLVGDACFSIDVTPDRSMATIAAAGRRDDGLMHVEVVEHRRGTDWVAARVAALLDSHDSADEVTIDGSGPAASLVPALENANVTVHVLTAKEHSQACGAFFDVVDQGAVRHLGSVEMASALKGAAKRPFGEAWAWSRRSSTVDISPLVACTLAAWGVECFVDTDVVMEVW